MKYRILDTYDGYLIQYKRLGIWWYLKNAKTKISSIYGGIDGAKAALKIVRNNTETEIKSKLDRKKYAESVVHEEEI
jgi:hypothetical protein